MKLFHQAKLLMILLLLAAATACGVPERDHDSTSPKTLEQWAYKFVKWNDTVYEITEETVDQSSVGEVIGTVLANIEKNDVINGNGNGEEEAAEKNGDSNYLPVGSKLYELTGVSHSEAIIVEDGNTFKKAVNVKR